MSLLDGGPALAPRTPTLAGVLTQTARRHGQQKIVHLHENGPQTALTYAQLLDRAQRVLAGLRRTLNQPGDILLLDIPDPAELICAYWACILGGFVPLPVPAAAGLLEQVWELHGHPRIITGTGRIIPSGLTPYSAGTFGYLAGHRPSTIHHQGAPGDLALLLLTSGSTGVPKAVRLTHANILARITATTHVNHLDHRQRTFNWMPLTHIGGLVMFHTRDVYLGAHQVHAPQQRILNDPLCWLGACHTHRITCTWAPNYAFALVNAAAADLPVDGWDLSRLTYIMNGGEPLHAEVIDRFMALLAPHGLPAGAMYPGWGMSETSSGVTDMPYLTDKVRGRYVPVGRPQPGTRMRITDEDHTVVPEGETGLVQVTGATVTSGYQGHDSANKAAFTPDGWFITGDLGHIQDGILTVTGRSDDQITLAGTAYHGHEIEAAVETLGFITPTCTVATEVSTAQGERLAVFCQPRTGTLTEADTDAVRTLLSERFAITGALVLAVGKSDVPKSGSGKLRRLPLRERFEESP
ncbi:AMP-binding protein [Streptomyces violascens]|uniref:AMP-binding protein n=1 Tax=Streptomyces violascens TaxID=67381 RepID=UPI00367FA46C